MVIIKGSEKLRNFTYWKLAFFFIINHRILVHFAMILPKWENLTNQPVLIGTKENKGLKFHCCHLLKCYTLNSNSKWMSLNFSTPTSSKNKSSWQVSKKWINFIITEFFKKYVNWLLKWSFKFKLTIKVLRLNKWIFLFNTSFPQSMNVLYI